MSGPEATWNDPQGGAPEGEPTWFDQPSVGSSGLGPLTERTLPRGSRVGEFEVRGELARGSMGVVYRARQVDLPDREVALKLIAAALDDPQAQLRFQREGEALARLDHPHVVRVHAAGILDDGRPYLAMELVRGKNLRQLAYEAGSLSPAEAAALLAPVARAVAHMHARGVLHRDLKLANVLLDEDGRPRVTDFGLAQLTDRETRLTQSQDMIGTPLYMAPEVVQGGATPDARADVYALGVMLFRLVVGRFPFYAGTPLALFQLIVRSPLEVPPEVPADLRAVLETALAKRAADRYPSAEALADDLESLTRGAGVSARRVSGWVRAGRRVRQHRAPLLGALALGLVGALTVGGLWIASERSEEAAARAAAEEEAAVAAQARAEALAALDAAGGALDAAALERLGARFDAAPAADAPPAPDDRRFVLAHAALSLLRGDRERAQALVAQVDEAGEASPALRALRLLLGARQDPERAEAQTAALVGSPDVLLTRLEALPRLGPSTTAQTELQRGQLLLQLRWPAGAAEAFQAAASRLKGWEHGLSPTWSRQGPGDAGRWLPLELAARCGLARARALLLDREAAQRALAAAQARAERFGDAALVGALRQLAAGPLPAPAPAFLPQGEAELAAWRAERRWRRARGRTKQLEAADLTRALGRAARAFRLALRQGEPAARAWAGLANVALARGDLPEARRCAGKAAGINGSAWEVEAARGRLALAEEQWAAGAATLRAACERLRVVPLAPIPRAALRYALLEEGVETLRLRGAPTAARLPLLERLATLTEEVPLTVRMRTYWHGKLLDAATRAKDERRAAQGRAGARRVKPAIAEIRRLYDAAQRNSKASHSLDNPEGERLARELEAASPTAADAYLLHALNFLRSNPRSIDPLVLAFQLEPAKTLANLTINLYQPESRELWGNDQRDKMLGWIRRGAETRGLPHPVDPDLREALVAMHCLFMRSPLAPADRVRALTAAARFQAVHPRARAASVVQGVIRIELGDPAGGWTDLRRAAWLHPLFPESRWRQTPRLILAHQSRAAAALGRTDEAVALLRRAIRGGLTYAWWIEDEPRFREDPTQPATLREPFRQLIQLQDQLRRK